MRQKKLWSSGALLVALLMVGSQTVTVDAASHTRFGAALTKEDQPSNAEGGQPCDDNAGIPVGSNCTWVSTEARHRPNGGEKAPKDGTIGKVRLISCVADSFRLQIARVKPSQDKARVVTNGPKIHPVADERPVCGGDDGDDYRIQVFKVTVPVHRGDYIAIKARETGMLYCSGGGGVLLFAPPLAPGGVLRHAQGDTGCLMLIELEYK